MLANITNKANIEAATYEKEIMGTLSKADAYAYEQKYNATSVVMREVAAAYDTAYTKISGKGFNAGDINHLEWSDFSQIIHLRNYIWTYHNPHGFT